MSNILIQNEFTNVGIATRVSRILLAKLICIFSGYAMITFNGLISSVWHALPIIIATYLLFTGLIGWDPINVLDQRLKLKASRSMKIPALPAT
jgi:hypothetical protein